MADGNTSRLQAPPRRPPRPYPFPYNPDTANVHPHSPGRRSERSEDSPGQPQSESPQQGEWPLPSNVRPRRPSQARRPERPGSRAAATGDRQRPPRNSPRHYDSENEYASFAQQHPYDWQYYEPKCPPRTRHHTNEPVSRPGQPPPYSVSADRDEQHRKNIREYGRAERGNLVNQVPLGPPPTARRGPVEDYPDSGPVNPIKEETEYSRDGNPSEHSQAGTDARANRYHQIHGSSTIPPTNQHKMRNPARAFHRPSYSMIVQQERPARHELEGNTSGTGSETENDGPVRKASLGKRSKPNLTVVINRESHRGKINKLVAVAGAQQQPSPNLANPPLQQHPAFRDEPDAIPGAACNDDDYQPSSSDVTGVHPTPRIIEPDHATIPDPDPTCSTATLPQHLQPVVYSNNANGTDTPPLPSVSNEYLQPETHSTSPNPKRRASRLSLRFSGRLSALWAPRSSPPSKATAKPNTPNTPNTEESQSQSQSQSSTPAAPRPSEIDLVAIQQAESRGSITSLADLIRRAGRLQTNLERGKTASRLGHSWFLDLSDERVDRERRKSEVVGVAATFDQMAGMEEGDARRGPAVVMEEEKEEIRVVKRRKTQCCGMPVWAFVLLIFVLVILTAAAVVIPVMLLVVKPYQK